MRRMISEKGAQRYGSDVGCVIQGSRGCRAVSSHPLDETVDHPLLAGLVELDEKLVAVDHADLAVAEFLVEHALAHGIGRCAGRFCDELTFDRDRLATPPFAPRAFRPRLWLWLAFLR